MSSRCFGLSIALLVLSACDSSIQLGERCERSAECADPFACVLGRCRAECVENGDCAFDAECHLVDGIGVCRLPTDVCEADTDCTAPLVCGEGGACRAICIENSDCAAGSRCIPSDGRNLCVPRREMADGGMPDAGSPSDAAPPDALPPDAGRACHGAINGRFALGLEGWCVEGSSGLDVRDHATVSGASGDARTITIDLTGVAAGEWIRLHQELDLDEGIATWAQFTGIDAPNGAVVVAIEALDATGALIGRSAYAQGAGVSAPCDATGRASDQCAIISRSLDVAILHGEALGRAGADLAATRTLRRSIEVIAGTASTRAQVDSFFGAEAPCPLAWWRADDVDVLRESMNHPATALEPTLTWAGDPSAPIHAYRTSICSTALALEGERWLERMAPLPLSEGPLTIELWWHGEIGTVPAVDRTHAMLWQGGGDLGLVIAGGMLRAVVGQCAEGGAALSVSDTAHPIGVGDERFQEVELLVDIDARQLCLYREGVEIGCDEIDPGCTPMPLTGGRLRIGAGLPAHERFRGAIDELRVRSGRHTPDATAADGRCFLDRVCAPGIGGRAWARDSGSGGCVRPDTACTTLSPCPQHALSGTACGPDPRDVCMLSGSCFQGVATCADGACRRADQCQDELRITPAACAP